MAASFAQPQNPQLIDRSAFDEEVNQVINDASMSQFGDQSQLNDTVAAVAKHHLDDGA